MRWEENPFYHPEECGLLLIDELRQPNMSYEFHLIAAWREVATGDLLWQEDNGCSCPVPFERVRSTDDLNRSGEELRKAVAAFPADPLEKRRFLDRVFKRTGIGP